MTGPGADRRKVVDALVDTPALARRLYPREPRAREDRGERRGPPAHALQVLVTFSDDPEQRVEDVAERLALNVASVSKALAKLEADGLIEERRSERDRRRRSRHLTPAGRRQVSALVRRARRLLAQQQPKQG